MRVYEEEEKLWDFQKILCDQSDGGWGGPEWAEPHRKLEQMHQKMKDHLEVEERVKKEKQSKKRKKIRTSGKCENPGDVDHKRPV